MKNTKSDSIYVEDELTFTVKVSAVEKNKDISECELFFQLIGKLFETLRNLSIVILFIVLAVSVKNLPYYNYLYWIGIIFAIFIAVINFIKLIYDCITISKKSKKKIPIFIALAVTFVILFVEVATIFIVFHEIYLKNYIDNLKIS